MMPQADVNVKQVQGLRQGVKKRVNIEQLASGLNKAVSTYPSCAQPSPYMQHAAE
jgi:hypothetical protein